MYLTQGVHRAMQQDPDAVATVCGGRVRTWGEGADRIARLAGALHGLGVEAGDRVGIFALNSDRYHETLLATWWAGAVVNPVNIRWSPKEIAYSLRESDTRVLLVDDAFAALVPALRAEWDGVWVWVFCGDGAVPEGMLSYESLIAGNEPVEDARRGGDDLAGIFYTGGTTGFPKGVMLSHDNLCAAALSAMATATICRPGGRVLTAAPMFHLAGLSLWNAQNAVRGSHVFVPTFDPVAVLEALSRHRPTSVLLVPAMIQMLVDHPRVAEFDLSSLEALFYGASPISQALLERAMKVLPNTRFTQGYGMTELSPTATLLVPEDHRDPELLRSAGRAMAFVDMRIADAEGREVPTGEVGEVLVRCVGMMQGYWERPQETADALRDGWMHTGDAGYVNDRGYLFLVDRIKDMIVTGGENVYSAEVENAVAQHPAVVTCAVIGVPDSEWGERVHAVIVLKQGHTATEAEIREHTKDLIAGYKAPRSCEFVEALPLTAAGKVSKKDLRAPYWETADRSVN